MSLPPVIPRMPNGINAGIDFSALNHPHVLLQLVSRDLPFISFFGVTHVLGLTVYLVAKLLTSTHHAHTPTHGSQLMPG